MPRTAFPHWLALLLALLGLLALYSRPLRTGFLNDDYLFLEEARTRPLAESLQDPGALGNYYRPLSRQIYFEALSPIAGGSPAVFHAVNFAIFLVSLALLFDLLIAFVPVAGAMAGTLWFAVLPFQRVNLTWVSCSQDLLALAGTLAALALFRRGRIAWALAAAAVALTSKESALPLPVALAAWDRFVAGRTSARTLRRTAPFWLLSLLWGAVALAITARQGGTPLHFDLSHLLAAYAHLVQSLMGIDHPAGWLRSLFSHAPAILPLVLLGALAAWLVARAPAAKEGVRPRTIVAFAAWWLAAFGAVTAPAASGWSAYYYTTAAAGGALLVALALRRIDRWLWVALVAVLLWWHAGGSATRAISVVEAPWGWTSHLTSGYFERAATLTDSLGRQLLRLEPKPPPGARFFFATLPPFAGFQMGNGAQVRALYRDTTLASYFYSRFSDSTAANRPARFFYWNGVELTPLYARTREPFFQVGTDLLLLDRPQGAEHAFLRGLAEGGNRMDHLYWLGWTEYWLGRRGAAEAAWTRFGARDDSLYWIAHLRAAHNAVTAGDTIAARRHLAKAIEFGIGRPEAHAVLGELLAAKGPEDSKYGMLELKVATTLSPEDWLARRELLRHLVAARLDDAARRELETLKSIHPEWRGDSTIVRAARTLSARGTGGSGGVVEF